VSVVTLCLVEREGDTVVTAQIKVREIKHERDNKAFTSMYGNDAEFINATNMMSVAKTMNKKFLDK